MKLAHLTRRFFGSLWPMGPAPADRTWAHSHLLDTERTLWDRMAAADRRHSVQVARDTVSLLDQADAGDVPREIVAAALLHDVGKIESGLGTMLRVVATVSAAIAGREMASAWTQSTGVTRRIGLYLEHPRIGGDLLGMAGSDPLTEAWAREHHQPRDSWTVPTVYASALDAADND